VLGCLAAAAAPGATLLATGVDPTAVPVLRQYAARNARVGRLPGQQRIRIRAGSISSSWFDYLYPTRADLTELVEDSPWRIADWVVDGADTLARLELAGPR
jgi:hypothetical protein